jgi:hypothetical protein
MLRVLVLVAFAFASTSHAEPVDNVFGPGVFGVPWGASLESVQARFPAGYTWETTRIHNTDFVHEARVESTLFSLGQPAVLVQFAFDESEKLHAAHIYYTHDRNQDVLYQIAQTLGHDYTTRSTKRETTHMWRSQSKLGVALYMGHGGPYKWTRLTVYLGKGS